MSIRLGVNIDHVATIRNARGEKHPEPLIIAKKAKKYKLNCTIGGGVDKNTVIQYKKNKELLEGL